MRNSMKYSMKYFMKHVKTLIAAWLVLFAFSVRADQFSISTVNVESPSVGVYSSRDYKFQYNRGDDKYWFVGYEQMNICPYYCGVKFELFGLGLGKVTDLGKVKLFTQAGYYYVRNDAHEESRFNENVHYYMVSRFSFGREIGSFKGYQVNNKNAIELMAGLDIPYSENTGFKLYYRHLQFWTNYVVYTWEGGYWHDPVVAKYNGYGVGWYYNF